MRILSIKQPWLYAITDLDKCIENRTWTPPTWIIGKRIGLHASAKDDQNGAWAIRDIAGVSIPPNLPHSQITSTAIVAGWFDEKGNGKIPDVTIYGI